VDGGVGAGEGEAVDEGNGSGVTLGLAEGGGDVVAAGAAAQPTSNSVAKTPCRPLDRCARGMCAL